MNNPFAFFGKQIYLYVLKVLKKYEVYCTKNEKLLHLVHLLGKKIFSINRREEHLEKENAISFYYHRIIIMGNDRPSEDYLEPLFDAGLSCAI